MASVFVRHGTEGPRYDPYSFTEVTFTKTNGDKIVAHLGLVCWIRLPDGSQKTSHDEVFDEFERCAGIKIYKALAVPELIRARRLRAMSPRERESALAIEESDAFLLRCAM